jgi:hypothetical protein
VSWNGYWDPSVICPFVVPSPAVGFLGSLETRDCIHLLRWGLLANLPAIYFFFTSYDNFLFGNLGYPNLNKIYRQVTSFPGPMTFTGKVTDLIKSVFAKPGELLILVVTLYSLVLFGIDTLRNAARPRFEIVFLLVLLPFAYVGSMAPTPTWYWYYFAPVPFLILLSLYALSTLRCSAFSEGKSISDYGSHFIRLFPLRIDSHSDS